MNLVRMMNRNIWSIWWLFILSFVVAQDPTVTLPQGRIIGIKVYPENSVTPVEIFYGIPYATAPVGRYRFAAPERHKGWRRTLFAHRMPPKCPQIEDNQNQYSSEDCLFLNIWTSRRADGSSLPVVVILYSESWERGGITLPCQELAAEGVVVVTVAYRLHMLSFFTLRSIAARGNLAILDQYLALLWVRDNIAAFGGDPTAITLMGHSTGADCVLHHMASPRSVGLFQRAIIMSPRNIWKPISKEANVNASESERVSLEMARSLGCTSDIDQEILQCMRARPLVDITTLYSKVNWSNVMEPTADSFLPASEQYLPTPLSVALSGGKQQQLPLDLLFGLTDIEAVNNNDIDYLDLLKQNFAYINEYANAKLIPDILRMYSLHESEVLPLLQQAIRWEFWDGKARSGDGDFMESVESLARMESSARWGTGGALLAARLARRVQRLFVYKYTQPGIDLHGRNFNFSVALSGGKQQQLPLDLLFGLTDIEAVNNNDIDYLDLLKQNFAYINEYANAKLIPDILRMYSLHESEVLPLLQQAIRWEFWDGKARSGDGDFMESVESLARMESSARWGTGGALLAARLARRVQRLFVYKYTQPGIDLHGRNFNFSGAVHGTDMVALLGDTLMLQVARRPATSDEKRISILFQKYIANFIKYGAPTPDEEWQRYKVRDAYIHEIRDRSFEPDKHCTDRGAVFWLQYLPQFANLMSSTGRTEQLTSDRGESRLRGGVFAMVGVSIGLLMLLLACAVLLHRERANRAGKANDPHF